MLKQSEHLGKVRPPGREAAFLFYLGIIASIAGYGLIVAWIIKTIRRRRNKK